MVSKQEGLEVSLVRMESTLASSRIDSVDGNASWIQTRYLIGKIRVYCSQLHPALAELSRSESTAAPDQVRTPCREMRAAYLELDRSAKIPFHCLDSSCPLLSSPRTTCWLNHLKTLVAASRQLETAPKNPVQILAAAPAPATGHSNSSSHTETRFAKRVRATRSLLQQTIELAVLVFAYLLYYFVDVYLQIVSLPPPVSWLGQ